MLDFSLAEEPSYCFTNTQDINVVSQVFNEKSKLLFGLVLFDKTDKIILGYLSATIKFDKKSYRPLLKIELLASLGGGLADSAPEHDSGFAFKRKYTGTILLNAVCQFVQASDFQATNSIAIQAAVDAIPFYQKMGFRQVAPAEALLAPCESEVDTILKTTGKYLLLRLGEILAFQRFYRAQRSHLDIMYQQSKAARCIQRAYRAYKRDKQCC